MVCNSCCVSLLVRKIKCFGSRIPFVGALGLRVLQVLGLCRGPASCPLGQPGRTQEPRLLQDRKLRGPCLSGVTRALRGSDSEIRYAIPRFVMRCRDFPLLIHCVFIDS